MAQNRFIRSAVRVGNAAQNALEVARFGGLDTGEEPSPFDVVGRTPVYRLRHYFPEHGGTGRPPMLLVPPLMLSAEVYDVSPRVSGVAALATLGVDPWVVDFGAPEKEEGGLQRTLADHVIAVGDAIDRVRRATGSDVHLGGYSQGGMFCYQTAAYRRGEGIASLVTFGSPVDTHLLSPAGLPVAQLADAAAALADLVLSRTSVPAGLSRRVFQMLDPLKTARQRLQFITQLHNREALLEREGSRRFLEVDGWVAWPGPAVAEFASQFLAHNRMLSGGFVIDDQLVSVADIDVPTLVAVGTADEIAAAPAVRAIRRAAPRADIWELTLDAGHMGLVVGNGAREHSWPVVAGWVHWQEGTAPRPEGISVLTEDHPEPQTTATAQVATDLAVGAAHLIADTARGTSRAVRGVLGEAMDQLPRLARLERVDADTRVSLGLLLDERTRRHPDDTFFLFQGRAHSYADARHRVDAIVRGLISVGVRQGDHVGVLMGTRPTAVALMAALSRLGAVAVMLRPDGDLGTEIRLGQVGRVIVDPANVSLAMAHVDDGLLVLGTGGDAARHLPDGVIDMEQIDHEAVELPAWFQPDPGRARDLALVSFTGQPGATRVNRITNRRWATSAFGTASAASLGRGDTVYAVTPVHHPSTMLTAIGGAVVSGARLAVAPGFTPETFWDEVRRYGVTVVSYTWAMCLELLQAEPTPAERHHPIRLFMGSGMPTGVWHRVSDRFRPARVLEFYAPTSGDVVLANVRGGVRGGKVGCKGRPLPGTAEVMVAAYDLDTGRLVIDDDGFVRVASVDEPGLLLARVGRDRGTIRGRLLRGVRERGDVWLSTGDLFRRDADGDLWLLGRPQSMVRTPDGPVSPFVVAAALEGVDAVELAAVYGVPTPAHDRDLLVGAVTARTGVQLTVENLLAGLSSLPRHQWPSVVRLIPTMPLSTHHRPQTAPLREEGVPTDAVGWWWDDAEGRYRSLDADAAAALMG